MTAEHQRGEERERLCESVCVSVYARGCSESQSLSWVLMFGVCLCVCVCVCVCVCMCVCVRVHVYVCTCV